MLVDVHQQGHTYHGLNSTTQVDHWWRSFDGAATKPGWILLAMFDHGRDNDQVIHQSLTLLKEATVTYIVLGMGSYPNGTVYGQDAIQDLINLKYKVMVLSASHVPQTWLLSSLLKPNADITTTRLAPLFEGMHLRANATGTPVLGYVFATQGLDCLLYTSPSPRDQRGSRMPSSA